MYYFMALIGFESPDGSRVGYNVLGNVAANPEQCGYQITNTLLSQYCKNGRRCKFLAGWSVKENLMDELLYSDERDSQLREVLSAWSSREYDGSGPWIDAQSRESILPVVTHNINV